MTGGANPPPEDWRARLGHSRTLRDVLAPDRIRGLAAILGQPCGDASVRQGAPLPALRHWLYFWDIVAQDQLGRDGHPRTGGFLPAFRQEDGAPARRMWGESTVRLLAPLQVGDRAQKRTTIDDIALKHGRSGRFARVRLIHDITSDSGGRLTETQSLVYRLDAARTGRLRMALRPGDAVPLFGADP